MLKKSLAESNLKGEQKSKQIKELLLQKEKGLKTAGELEAERIEKDILNQYLIDVEREKEELAFILSNQQTDSAGIESDMKRQMNIIKNELDLQKTQNMNEVCRLKDK